MQVVHLGFSIGAILSPLASEPFLAKGVTQCNQEEYNKVSNTRTTDAQYGSLISVIHTTLEPDDGLVNNTRSHSTLTNCNCTKNITNINFETKKCVHVYGETLVFYAYLLASVIILIGAVGFTYEYLCLSKLLRKTETKPSGEVTRSNKLKYRKWSLRLKVVFVILLATLMAAYCIVEDVFSSFFMTFGLEYLSWKKQTGALAATAFWTAFGVGRFIGIFLVTCLSSRKILTTYLLLLTIGLLGFLFSSQFSFYPLVWVFVVVIGLSMSAIYPGRRTASCAFRVKFLVFL